MSSIVRPVRLFNQTPSLSLSEGLKLHKVQDLNDSICFILKVIKFMFFLEVPTKSRHRTIKKGKL